MAVDGAHPSPSPGSEPGLPLAAYDAESLARCWRGASAYCLTAAILLLTFAALDRTRFPDAAATLLLVRALGAAALGFLLVLLQTRLGVRHPRALGVVAAEGALQGRALVTLGAESPINLGATFAMLGVAVHREGRAQVDRALRAEGDERAALQGSFGRDHPERARVAHPEAGLQQHEEEPERRGAQRAHEEQRGCGVREAGPVERGEGEEQDGGGQAVRAGAAPAPRQALRIVGGQGQARLGPWRRTGMRAVDGHRLSPVRG